MKKLLAVLLVLALSFSVSACSNSDSEEDRYNQAIELYLAGDYHQAFALFEELGEYKNAEQFIEDIASNLALAEMPDSDDASDSPEPTTAAPTPTQPRPTTTAVTTTTTPTATPTPRPTTTAATTTAAPTATPTPRPTTTAATTTAATTTAATTTAATTTAATTTAATTAATTATPTPEPPAGVTIKFPSLPLEVIHGSIRVRSKMEITNLSYSYNADREEITIYTTGEKTYDLDGDSGTNYIDYSWQLLDDEGYVAHSGFFIKFNLHVGDKFRDDDYVKIWGVKPGSYTFRISDR